MKKTSKKYIFSKMEGTSFFMNKKVQKIKYNWFRECAPRNKIGVFLVKKEHTFSGFPQILYLVFPKADNFAIIKIIIKVTKIKIHKI